MIRSSLHSKFSLICHIPVVKNGDAIVSRDKIIYDPN